MGRLLGRGNRPGIRHGAPRVQRPRLAHREDSVSRDDLAERWRRAVRPSGRICPRPRRQCGGGPHQPRRRPVRGSQGRHRHGSHHRARRGPNRRWPGRNLSGPHRPRRHRPRRHRPGQHRPRRHRPGQQRPSSRRPGRRWPGLGRKVRRNSRRGHSGQRRCVPHHFPRHVKLSGSNTKYLRCHDTSHPDNPDSAKRYLACRGRSQIPFRNSSFLPGVGASVND
jgi:hypothetical protein